MILTHISKQQMFSLLLICFAFCPVLSLNSLSSIQVLDNYFEDAAKFMKTRSPADEISLLLPKRSIQPQASIQPLHVHPLQALQPLQVHPLQALQPIQVHPLQAIQPLNPFQLITNFEAPAYQPIFRSRIVPKNYQKYKKRPKSKSLSNNPTKHKKEERNQIINYNKYNYPKSISDRIRGKGSDDQNDPEFDDNNENDEKSNNYYKDLPPFSRPQGVQQSKSYYNLFHREISSPKGPSLEDKERPNKPSNSFKGVGIPKNSLYNSSPPFSTPNRMNSMKPSVKSSNLPLTTGQGVNDNKHRTATANQLSLKESEKNSDKHSVNNKNEDSVPNDIGNEDLDSNDDPNHYPHQYAIEIRWKNKNNEFFDLNAPEGDVGDREMHSSKDMDHAKYRHFKHEEEEHWHEKKWLNEGLRKAYMNGQSLPVHIVKPNLKIESNAHYNPIPLYAQPLPDGATLEEINKHFAVPTPNFRVNNRFIQWAKSAIDLSRPQNNLISLLG